MSERQPNGRLAVIRREEYLPYAEQKHLFLAGNLQLPNSNPFVREARLEWIMCFYENGDDGIPHWHAEVTEYETILEGQICYVESLTGETSWLQTGDFTTIPAGVCVRRIIRERSRTVAVKVPSNSERVVCTGCARECPSRLQPYLGNGN